MQKAAQLFLIRFLVFFLLTAVFLWTFTVLTYLCTTAFTWVIDNVPPYILWNLGICTLIGLGASMFYFVVEK